MLASALRQGGHTLPISDVVELKMTRVRMCVCVSLPSLFTASEITDFSTLQSAAALSREVGRQVLLMREGVLF